LERLPESAPKDTAVHTVGQLMKEAGVACAAVLDAYEDGKLTRAERETCLRVLGAVQRKLSDAIAIISGAAICEDDDEEAAA
ncbi:hypothetical protein, partial [Breoghania sp. JC706]|uniref:hypothetical protein n=1 Tax=Breoghania sp. JC706 TaxID=3117732 RepID=UPI00300A8B5E